MLSERLGRQKQGDRRVVCVMCGVCGCAYSVCVEVSFSMESLRLGVLIAPL